MNAEMINQGRPEELLAELAAATYRVARRHDFKGAFIDIELDLWDAQRTMPATTPSVGRLLARQ